MVDSENDPVAAGFSRWRGTGSWGDLNFPTGNRLCNHDSNFPKGKYVVMSRKKVYTYSNESTSKHLFWGGNNVNSVENIKYYVTVATGELHQQKNIVCHVSCISCHMRNASTKNNNSCAIYQLTQDNCINKKDRLPYISCHRTTA